MWDFLGTGGFVMIPLILGSLIIWAVIIERLWNYLQLARGLRSFHLEAMNAALQGDEQRLKNLFMENRHLPTARLFKLAYERKNASDKRKSQTWWEATQRERQIVNLELKRYLWLLGTIGSAAPFVGLFGTVVGILRTFGDLSKNGVGGFAVVSGGISEALIATAAGIVVGVVAVFAYNAFQTKLSVLALTIRLQLEEFGEIISLEQEKPNGV